MNREQQKKRGHFALLKFLIITGMLMISVSLSWAGNNACTAATDMQTNTLHVPCLEHVGKEYWVDFDITSMSPVQLQLKKAGKNTTTCQDDDTAQGIYRGCNYFPLDTGNMWNFNEITFTVSGATHTFSGGTGKRVNNLAGYCVSQDIFLASNDNGIVFFGTYERDESSYEEFPVQYFQLLPNRYWKYVEL